MMNLNKKKEVRRNKFLANMKIMNTDISEENVNYVLDNNRSYKILLLYILRTLNNDVKQKIVKKLINEEILYCYIFLEH